MRLVRTIAGLATGVLFVTSLAYGQYLAPSGPTCNACSRGRGATVAGVVKGPDGKPFMGAFVQAQNLKKPILVSVLSGQDGRYRIPNLSAGEYTLQIHAVGFKANSYANVKLAGRQHASYNFALEKGMVHWGDLSVYQGQKLWPDSAGKQLVDQRCFACHGFQNFWAPHMGQADLTVWQGLVTYMRTGMGYFLNNPRRPFTDQDAATSAEYLTSLFGKNSVLPESPADMPGYKEVEDPPPSAAAMNIVYVEYELLPSGPGGHPMPWSADPDTKDGSAWMPNYGDANTIGRLNPETGSVELFRAPNQSSAGIHSAVPAPDGSVWFTEQGANKLGRWDPKTQQITEYQDDAGKHTARVGPTGEIWFSGARGSFNPKTGKFTHYGGGPSGNGAYGIALDQEGDAWYASGNYLVRVDGKTRQIETYTPPTHQNNFDRRIQVDSDGSVWFAEYNHGKLTRFDPKTKQFKEYQLPGPDPSPYALWIDNNHDIWYSSEWTDIIGRFDPSTGKTVIYPFPQSENTMREFFGDSEGRIWFATPANDKVGYFYIAGGASESARK
ncbi:MAG TPA: carboxypeptidase regulatory-like domain-containing protein [Patescibacteria group bacterium]|nr:carboxypeptidase regulatory-like domain-containing protein [Patescibacteria group bacterium]